MKKTTITYTDNDRAIVAAVKNAPEGLTLAEINEATGLKIVAGHIVAAMKKELIQPIGTRLVEKPTTREVSTYKLVTADALSRGGKPFNYTDNEKEILAKASTIEGAFTLAQLSDVMGRKISSGSTNGLIKKGNLVKDGSVTVPGVTKTTVNVYGFVKDVPAAN